jgi:hypothetical protein
MNERVFEFIIAAVCQDRQVVGLYGFIAQLIELDALDRWQHRNADLVIREHERNRRLKLVRKTDFAWSSATLIIRCCSYVCGRLCCLFGSHDMYIDDIGGTGFVCCRRCSWVAQDPIYDLWRDEDD